MRFLAVMVQLWVIPGERLRKRDSDQCFKAGGGGTLSGMRARRLIVIVLATLCSLIVVLGWEGSPAASVLGSRGWRPAIRLELEIAARKASPVTKVYKKASDQLEFPECDYSRGKWLKDADRPLYTGETCKQFLSTMWACKLLGREDDYEQYRWQPEGCDLPRFDGLSFLSRWRNKTIAFIGDSLGRQQFQSLLCMITSGRDNLVATDVSRKYGFHKRPAWAFRPNGWAYRFRETNTTILFYWSASLCSIKPYNASDPSSAAAMHIDRPVDFLRKNIHRLDMVVLNTGHHWNSGKITGNKWEMHLAGKRVARKSSQFASVSYSHRFAVKNVVRWLDKQIARRPGMRGFLTALSPRHFMNGDWNSGGRCDNIKALGVDVSKRPSRDIVAEDAVANTRVELINTTYLSQFRGEAHISTFSASAKEGIQDCLHWCLPGVPDVWNEILNAQLLATRREERAFV